MRKYELVCIFHPDLDETAFNANLDKVKGWITENGGTVDKLDVWGKRRLAYIIKKQKEGTYVLLNISLPNKSTGILDQNLRFLEPVIRYMLTVVN